ncbi:GmrSD restriction endonuclease domain-containing protein [Arthrobacter sp. TMN-37]
MPLRTRITAFLLGSVLAAGAAGCSPALQRAPAAESPAATAPAATTPPASPSGEQQVPPGTPDPDAPAPPAGTALAGLQLVPIKGRAPRTGYDRDRFGPAWADTDRNGCDTRNDVLADDLSGESFTPGTRDCVVQAGVLNDPYTAARISFVKGGDALVDIDHVVALGNAWETGAQRLSAEDRRLFANDPLNLLAVDGPANRQKGDADAATWLPPNKAFRCAYVARQTAVKLRYRLWMTPPEHAAIGKVLSSCPDEPLPAAGTAPPGGPAAGAGEEVPGAGRPPAGTAGEPPAGGVPYGSCADVEAAGAAPITAADPGWDPSFDRDGDGIGCQ